MITERQPLIIILANYACIYHIPLYRVFSKRSQEMFWKADLCMCEGTILLNNISLTINLRAACIAAPVALCTLGFLLNNVGSESRSWVTSWKQHQKSCKQYVWLLICHKPHKWRVNCFFGLIIKQICIVYSYNLCFDNQKSSLTSLLSFKLTSKSSGEGRKTSKKLHERKNSIRAFFVVAKILILTEMNHPS